MLQEPIDALPLVPDARDDLSAFSSLTANIVQLRPDEQSTEVEERLPHLALAYILAVFVAGVASVIVFAPQLDTHDIGGLIVLGVLAVVFGRMRIQIYGETSVSIDFFCASRAA